MEQVLKSVQTTGLAKVWDVKMLGKDTMGAFIDIKTTHGQLPTLLAIRKVQPDYFKVVFQAGIRDDGVIARQRFPLNAQFSELLEQNMTRAPKRSLEETSVSIEKAIQLTEVFMAKKGFTGEFTITEL
jgi:hypothetical protein